ncbi:hypothetical protein GGD54_006407, partial [Rhizobium tropici]|nr:hypothetical protein [Rhizobium tropici]MBB6495939.1 hypothetical protein [Rhizobium tropici]
GGKRLGHSAPVDGQQRQEIRLPCPGWPPLPCDRSHQRKGLRRVSDQPCSGAMVPQRIATDAASLRPCIRSRIPSRAQIRFRLPPTDQSGSPRAIADTGQSRKLSSVAMALCERLAVPGWARNRARAHANVPAVFPQATPSRDVRPSAAQPCPILSEKSSKDECTLSGRSQMPIRRWPAVMKRARFADEQTPEC